MKDFYKILKLDEGASGEEIKKAFRREALLAHPDKGGQAEQMQMLNEAYEILSDPKRRKIFDEEWRAFKASNEEETDDLFMLFPRLTTVSRSFSYEYRRSHTMYKKRYQKDPLRPRKGRDIIQPFENNIYLGSEHGVEKNYSDIFSLVHEKAKKFPEHHHFKKPSKALTPRDIFEWLIDFLSGRYFGKDLLEMQEYLQPMLRKEDQCFLLYQGITEILAIAIKCSTSKPDLLAALQKIMVFASYEDKEHEQSLVLMLQNKYFRHLFLQAIHAYWESDENLPHEDNLKLFDGRKLLKMFLRNFRMALSRKRSAGESCSVIRNTIQLLKFLYQIDREVYGSDEKRTAKFYREKAYYMLDWVPTLKDTGLNQLLLFNILMQAGICFQQAAVCEVEPTVQMADETIALELYSLIHHVGKDCAPNEVMYSYSHILKCLMSFHFDFPGFRPFVQLMQNRVVVLADMFPFLEPIQPNVNFTLDSSYYRMREVSHRLLRTLVEEVSRNKRHRNERRLSKKSEPQLPESDQHTLKALPKRLKDLASELESFETKTLPEILCSLSDKEQLEQQVIKSLMEKEGEIVRTQRQLNELRLMLEQKDSHTRLDHREAVILYYAYEACIDGWYDFKGEEREHVERRMRLNLMQALLREKGWRFTDVVPNLVDPWIMVDRDESEWMRPSCTLPLSKNPTLPIFQSLAGLEINFKTGELEFVLREWEEGMPEFERLFTLLDLLELIEYGFCWASFSLDPIDPNMRHHPFNEMRISPSRLYGTQLMQTMFLTDYLLKFFTIGKEVQGKKPYDTRSLDTLMQQLPLPLKKIINDYQRAETRRGEAHRFWIEMKKPYMAVYEEPENGLLRLAFSPMEMVVKKHRMERDIFGRLVDDVNEKDEGWKMYLLTDRQKEELVVGKRSIEAPAMVFVEGKNEVYFYEEEEFPEMPQEAVSNSEEKSDGVGERLQRGIFDREEYVFREHTIISDGDYGFMGLGTDRDEAVGLLLKEVHNKEIREIVALEIVETAWAGNLPNSMRTTEGIQELGERYDEAYAVFDHEVTVVKESLLESKPQLEVEINMLNPDELIDWLNQNGYKEESEQLDQKRLYHVSPVERDLAVWSERDEAFTAFVESFLSKNGRQCLTFIPNHGQAIGVLDAIIRVKGMPGFCIWSRDEIGNLNLIHHYGDIGHATHVIHKEDHFDLLERIERQVLRDESVEEKKSDKTKSTESVSKTIELSPPISIEKYSHLLFRLSKEKRDENGQIIKDQDNNETSQLIYVLTRVICRLTKKPMRCSPEYIFAQEFTINYDYFAIHFPEFGRLRELSKVVALLGEMEARRERNTKVIENLEEELRDEVKWRREEEKIAKMIQQNERKYESTYREIYDEEYESLKNYFSKRGEQYNNSYQKHVNRLRELYNAFQNSIVDYNSREVQKAIEERIWEIKSKINRQASYEGVSFQWTYSETRDLEKRVQSKVRQDVEEINAKTRNDFSDMLRRKSPSNVSAYDINALMEGNVAPLARKLDKLDESEMFHVIKEELPVSASNDEIEYALGGYSSSISSLAKRITEYKLSKSKKQLDENNRDLSRVVGDVKEKLRSELSSAKRLESQFRDIGFWSERRKRKIDLTEKCLWVPASINHDRRQGRLVYGGVSLFPRIEVLREGHLLRNSLVNAAFASDETAGYKANYLSQVREVNEKALGSRTDQNIQMLERLNRFCTEQREKASASGENPDEFMRRTSEGGIAASHRDGYESDHGGSASAAGGAAGSGGGAGGAGGGGCGVGSGGGGFSGDGGYRSPPPPPFDPPSPSEPPSSSSSSSSSGGSGASGGDGGGDDRGRSGDKDKGRERSPSPTFWKEGEGKKPDALMEALRMAKPTPGKDNQLETRLEDGTIVLFRRDIGEHAHALGKHYDDDIVRDHYNVQIQKPKKSIRGGNKTIENLHLVVNEKLELIDILTEKVRRKDEAGIPDRPESR